MKHTEIDPFSAEIIRNAIQAISDEMFVCLRKAAMSSNIYETLDFSVAIMDGKGQLACQGAGLEMFIGLLGAGPRAILDKFGKTNDIREGDIFITNDPYNGGGSHLNDVVMLKPVFYKEQLVAWMSNKAHWSDIGGMTAGGMSPLANEIFQEGLQFPEIKLFDAGKQNQAVIDMVEANSRWPDITLGDMWACIASLKTGESRFLELIERFGAVTVETVIEEFIDYGESITLRALAKLPNGVYEAEELFEDGQPMRVKIRITDEVFEVDLRNNPPQHSGPFNASYVGTWTSCQILFKAITTPGQITNEGSFKPMKLLTDKGSIFDAERPAAAGFYFEPMSYAMDIIWKAMAPIAKNVLPAAQFNSLCSIHIVNKHPDNDSLQMMMQCHAGGWGGGVGKDGETGLFSTGGGELFFCPFEIRECRTGIEVVSARLHDYGGGEGRYRGGRGIEYVYRIRAEKASLTTGFMRTKNPPWGVNGGRPGSLNSCTVMHVDSGEEEVCNSVCELPLKKGDLVRIVSASGGGWGEPGDRPTELIIDDVKNGYVTTEQAKQIYGL
ncbi:MAG: hydantoinase B/oxoprolinase family protein [Gammaproteobacteria bacterium]|jgi:N-methylhydantoinase B|nr:hydantoinase B/oxoprolinase family protein [Gammaproteobacteria bacterium]